MAVDATGVVSGAVPRPAGVYLIQMAKMRLTCSAMSPAPIAQAALICQSNSAKC